MDVATLPSIQVSAMDFESADTCVWQHACHTYLLETHSGNLIFGRRLRVCQRMGDLLKIHGRNYVKWLAVVFRCMRWCNSVALHSVTQNPQPKFS